MQIIIVTNNNETYEFDKVYSILDTCDEIQVIEKTNMELDKNDIKTILIIP